MFDRLRAWLIRVLKVPVEPRPPAGERHVVRTFRAAPNYLRYKKALWAIAQAVTLLGLIWGLLVLETLVVRFLSGTVLFLARAAEVLGWAAFLAQVPIGYALLRLDFEMRWYILSDRSLHIREGMLRVREQTITFANIQHITIRQNPLQRLLRIADVIVRTAGGGAGTEVRKHAGSGGMHEALFRGVDNADEIRDAIRERVRLHRDAGLGDPDDPEPVERRSGDDAVAAAKAVLAEVRALRAASATPGERL